MTSNTNNASKFGDNLNVLNKRLKCCLDLHNSSVSRLIKSNEDRREQLLQMFHELQISVASKTKTLKMFSA